MKKKEINVFDYASDILAELKKGVLVTTRVDDKINSMTISWGMLGIDWAMPVFITFIRTGRFTHEMLRRNPRFTVNIPRGDASARSILAFCGTQSGRDCDKVARLGLTPVWPDASGAPAPDAVPAIAQLPLTLECRVVYSQLQNDAAIPQHVKDRFYPAAAPGTAAGANQDYHTVFYGEIERAYILDED